MEALPRSIADAFDPESFRRMGHTIVDMLADYLKQAEGGVDQAVLPDISPADMLGKWPEGFPEKGGGDLRELLHRTIEQSNHLHHPGYIGHQVTSPLPLAALCEFVGSLLNNASAVYEMGPVNSIMERRLIQWMAGLIGFGADADGVFTSGGSLGNLTALLAARQAASGCDAWTNGIAAAAATAILVSEQAHYSIKRAAGIMGLGESAVVTVPVDARFRMDLNALRERYDECLRQKRRVLLVAACACSTPTGTFDNLEKIADFCEERGVWLHVDGAHGASLLLTDAYRHLLRGIHRADSVVWDAHKMMLMPALITAVIFKNGSRSYESFSQAASYLFEKESREEWYNYAQRTMECTKVMMGMRLYIPLSVYGTGLFANYVASRVDLAKEFAAIISASQDFELAVEPECNIVCFRMKNRSGQDRDDLQKLLRKRVLESEKFYIVQTRLPAGFFLRCTIINPLTTIEDLRRLLDAIRYQGA